MQLDPVRRAQPPLVLRERYGVQRGGADRDHNTNREEDAQVGEEWGDQEEEDRATARRLLTHQRGENHSWCHRVGGAEGRVR